MDDLATVRRKLAEAKIALRESESDLHSARLEAELALIEKKDGDPKAVGSNDVDRKRAYEIACEGDADYIAALYHTRGLQDAVERLQVELDILLDARRERDMDLRERYIAVLESQAATFVSAASLLT